MATPWALLDLLLALALAPLLPGVIARVEGALRRPSRPSAASSSTSTSSSSLRKGAVYSDTTTWVFRAGPVVALAASVCALLLVPCGRARRALVSFPVDFVLLAYLLALGSLLHGQRRARHGLELRGHGRQPRGAVRRALASRRCSWACWRWPARRARSRSPRSCGAASPLAPEVAARRRGARGRAALRERARPVRRPDHTPRADHDPRGDGARPRRARPGFHAVRGRRCKLWLWSALLVGVLAARSACRGPGSPRCAALAGMLRWSRSRIGVVESGDGARAARARAAPAGHGARARRPWPSSWWCARAHGHCPRPPDAAADPLGRRAPRPSARLGRVIGLVAVPGRRRSARWRWLVHHGPLAGRALLLGDRRARLVRGLLFPFLLRRAARQRRHRRGAQPARSGSRPRCCSGIAMLGGAMALGCAGCRCTAPDLPSPDRAGGPLHDPHRASSWSWPGRKALTQCLGYLVLENGIYGFGVATVGEVPALVELGVLLDLFLAVLVMGIAMYRMRGGVRPHGHRPARRRCAG